MTALSVILPAYNEEENIGDAIDDVLTKLRGLVDELEVVVVDDGSTDRTGAIIDEYAKKYDIVKAVHHGKNKGYGAALRSGFNTARHPLLFYTDADLQFDVSEVKYFLPMLDSYDVVVGFRVYRYDSVTRCILSWGYKKLAWIVFGINLRDIDCAFKLFKRKVFDKIKITSANFFVDTEVMAKIKHHGFSVNQIGVRHYPRRKGRTNVRPCDIPRTLQEVWRIWREMHFEWGKRD